MGVIFTLNTRGKQNISFLRPSVENRKFWRFPTFTTKKDGKFYLCIEEPHKCLSDWDDKNPVVLKPEEICEYILI